MTYHRASEFWTDERIDRMKKMVSAGNSFSEIGKELGCTRNAAIGKAKRLGLSDSSNRGGRKPNPKVAPSELRGAARSAVVTRMRRQKIREAEMESIAPLSTSEVTIGDNVRWIEEQSAYAACWECFQPRTMCHWPVRDRPFQFCGAPKIDDPNVPYCTRHTIISRRGDKP